MIQVLDMGLAPEVLQSMSHKARESLLRPGVAIEIPRAMVNSLDCVLQDVLTEQLLVLREHGRNLAPDTLELRIR